MTQTITKEKSKITPPKKLITGEELFRMPDMGSAELVAGEIVTQIPTGHPHGFIESMLAFFLNLFVREQKL
ncbi:MAG: hypothetical protein IAF02_14010, partial [Anaerolineae bacterium]|nr:hypothetical protein [Anaerolineae bacterium]